jgi:hypothetical protein
MFLFVLFLVYSMNCVLRLLCVKWYKWLLNGRGVWTKTHLFLLATIWNKIAIWTFVIQINKYTFGGDQNRARNKTAHPYTVIAVFQANGPYFRPSGVRALSLAAGINEGGHYFR